MQKQLRFFFITAICVSCQPSPPPDRPSLYSIFLAQIVYDNHYSHCFDIYAGNQRLEEVSAAYDKGRIDSEEMTRITDSLKIERRKTTPACPVSYDSLLRVVQTGLDEDKKFFLNSLLRDTYFIESFPDHLPLDSLFLPCEQTASDFHIDFLKVIPYDREVQGPYGEGGVISLSNILLNKEGNKAVLYYEYRCGGKCGVGKFVLAERRWGKWTIEKYIETWIS